MRTDRPDVTESPYTLERGHVQLEMSIVDYVHDRRTAGGARHEALSVAPLLLKLGVSQNMDVQLGWEPWVVSRDTESGPDRDTGRGEGASSTRRGTGDLTVRAKFNLWGNDGGSTACALLPFCVFPAARNDLGVQRLEGGLAMPMEIDLGADFALGLMQEVDVICAEAGRRSCGEWVHTVTLDVPLHGSLSGFVEYAGAANMSHDQGYRGYVNTGAVYALSPNVQLDAGIRVGLTRAAEDIGMFAGLSLRR